MIRIWASGMLPSLKVQKNSESSFCIFDRGQGRLVDQLLAVALLGVVSSAVHHCVILLLKIWIEDQGGERVLVARDTPAARCCPAWA